MASRSPGLINILLAMFSIFSGIIGLEVFSYIFFSFVLSEDIVVHELNPSVRFSSLTHKTFRLSRPLPYLGSEYFDWFMDYKWSGDYPECVSRVTHDGTGLDLQQTDTQSCPGFSVIGGWRFTEGHRPVEPSTRNIYIYMVGLQSSVKKSPINTLFRLSCSSMQMNWVSASEFTIVGLGLQP